MWWYTWFCDCALIPWAKSVCLCIINHVTSLLEPKNPPLLIKGLKIEVGEAATQKGSKQTGPNAERRSHTPAAALWVANWPAMASDWVIILFAALVIWRIMPSMAFSCNRRKTSKIYNNGTHQMAGADFKIMMSSVACAQWVGELLNAPSELQKVKVKRRRSLWWIIFREPSPLALATIKTRSFCAAALSWQRQGRPWCVIMFHKC
jgi:hypothetical protein